MKSPLTGQENTVLADKFSTKQICNFYKTELGLNVDRFFKNVSEVEVWKCKESGYRFYAPDTVFGDALFYEELQAIKGGDYYPENKWEYDQALKYVTADAQLLEIGCGVGYFLEKAINKKASVCGLELNAQAVEACKNKNLNVSLETLDEHSTSNQGFYDIVCAFQVLEHITDIGRFINQCLYVLKPGGLFIFAVPNSNPYIFKYDKYHTLNLPPHHAGLWNNEVVQRLTAFFPIEIIQIGHEPLKEYKKWYGVQIRQLKITHPLLSLPLQFLPRQLYKTVLKLFKNKIHGISMLSVVKKK